MVGRFNRMALRLRLLEAGIVTPAMALSVSPRMVRDNGGLVPANAGNGLSSGHDNAARGPRLSVYKSGFMTTFTALADWRVWGERRIAEIVRSDDARRKGQPTSGGTMTARQFSTQSRPANFPDNQ